MEQTLTPNARVAEVMQKAGRLAAIEKGTLVFSEGLPISTIPLVQEGRVRVFSSTPGGDEITLYEIGAGQTCVLAAASVLTHRDYPAIAIAETKVSAWLVPSGRFLELFGHDPEFQRSVFDLLTGRLAVVMGLVGQVAFQPMQVRLAAYLSQRADQAGVLHETHSQIATNLGTAREVVSRLIEDMERNGAVHAARGRVQILNRTLLSRLASGQS